MKTKICKQKFHEYNVNERMFVSADIISECMMT